MKTAEGRDTKEKTILPDGEIAAVSKKDTDMPGNAPCVRVYRKDKNSAMPYYATNGAAGADVKACIPEDCIIQAGERKKIPTGLVLEIPAGWEAQLRPRSGLALNHGITILNAPGTIDSDYRGELEVLLINLGKEAYTVRNGDRIAQLIFSPAPQLSLEEVKTPGTTDRGKGGFGSTGMAG